MTRQLEVSILAAPVAAMDRRALSQAWYSALHVAQNVPQQPQFAVRPSHCAVVQGTMSSRERRSQFDHRAAGSVPPARQDGARTSRDVTPELSPAQRTRSALSRRIELRFASTAQPVARATFSLGRGSERVHIIMQSNGCTARLVAICRPQLREIVARALAEARLALRSRGITVATALPLSSAPEAGECF
jgi:hypothetical protein